MSLWKNAQEPMPSQTKKSEGQLEDLIPSAHGLAKRLREAIHKARDLRRAACQADSRLTTTKVPRRAPRAPSKPPPKSDVLRTKARKTTEAASRLLGRLLHLKDRIEIGLLRADTQYGTLREALQKLTIAKAVPATHLWPAAVSFDEETTLQALDRFEMLLDLIPLSGSPIAAEPQLDGPLKNGQFCDRVIDEIRKIRHLYRAGTMAQIRSDHPNFLIWSIIESPDTDAEDRDIFHHPNRWGPAVGYAVKLLARHFGRSEETILRWRKAYRRHKTRSGVTPA